jgi:hypothetical protein
MRSGKGFRDEKNILVCDSNEHFSHPRRGGVRFYDRFS